MQLPILTVCFDWGGTLMSEIGPQDRPMCAWPEVHVLDGVVACLDQLAPSHTLCIATNASISHQKDIQAALDRGGIGHYFKHIFCHMDLGLKKNQPGFWAAVQRSVNHPLSQVAMVGDSLEHDAVAPRRFGVQAYWLHPAHSAHDPDPGVPVVTELQAFAAAVCRGR